MSPQNILGRRPRSSSRQGRGSPNYGDLDRLPGKSPKKADTRSPRYPSRCGQPSAYCGQYRRSACGCVMVRCRGLERWVERVRSPQSTPLRSYDTRLQESARQYPIKNCRGVVWRESAYSTSDDQERRMQVQPHSGHPGTIRGCALRDLLAVAIAHQRHRPARTPGQ